MPVVSQSEALSRARRTGRSESSQFVMSRTDSGFITVVVDIDDADRGKEVKLTLQYQNARGEWLDRGGATWTILDPGDPAWMRCAIDPGLRALNWRVVQETREAVITKVDFEEEDDRIERPTR